MEHIGFDEIEEKRDVSMLPDFKRAVKAIRTFIGTLEHEESSLFPAPKADSKVDSKAERKPRTTVDIGGQNGTERKTPGRARSRLNQGRLAPVNS